MIDLAPLAGVIAERMTAPGEKFKVKVGVLLILGCDLYTGGYGTELFHCRSGRCTRHVSVVRRLRRHLSTEHDGVYGADGPREALPHGRVRLQPQQVSENAILREAHQENTPLSFCCSKEAVSKHDLKEGIFSHYSSHETEDVLTGKPAGNRICCC